jgi:hypothetical protein
MIGKPRKERNSLFLDVVEWFYLQMKCLGNCYYKWGEVCWIRGKKKSDIIKIVINITCEKKMKGIKFGVILHVLRFTKYM